MAVLSPTNYDERGGITFCSLPAGIRLEVGAMRDKLTVTKCPLKHRVTSVNGKA